MQPAGNRDVPALAPGTRRCSGRDLVTAVDRWRGQELARITAQLAPPQLQAVTTELGLLVAAAGDDYGNTAARYHCESRSA
jgi:hypothetical protein